MTNIPRRFRAAAAVLRRRSRKAARWLPQEAVLPGTEKRCDQESFAQVAGLVAPNPAGGLKPGGSTTARRYGRTIANGDGRTVPIRPAPLGVRFSEAELAIVKSKARASGCTTNGYIRASALGSSYSPPLDPELKRVLLAFVRELNAQGNNLNQIARQVNAGIVPSGQGAVLAALSCSIQDTLRRVREALGPGKPDLTA